MLFQKHRPCGMWHKLRDVAQKRILVLDGATGT